MIHINGCGWRVPSKKMITCLKKLQTLLKLEVGCANPSLCSLHFRGESEEESHIIALIVKITPGEKKLRMYNALKDNQTHKEHRAGKSSDK